MHQRKNTTRVQEQPHLSDSASKKKVVVTKEGVAGQKEIIPWIYNLCLASTMSAIIIPWLKFGGPLLPIHRYVVGALIVKNIIAGLSCTEAKLAGIYPFNQFQSQVRILEYILFGIVAGFLLSNVAIIDANYQQLPWITLILMIGFSLASRFPEKVCLPEFTDTGLSKWMFVIFRSGENVLYLLVIIKVCLLRELSIF
jgi:hypothetical protein